MLTTISKVPLKLLIHLLLIKYYRRQQNLSATERFDKSFHTLSLLSYSFCLTWHKVLLQNKGPPPLLQGRTQKGRGPPGGRVSRKRQCT